jgi:hypothetical protein
MINQRNRYRIAVLGLFVLLAGSVGLSRHLPASAAAVGATSQTRKPSPARRPAQTRRGGLKPKVDYTRFSHRSTAHQLACDSCHKFPSKDWKEARPADAAFPDVTEFPEHASCLQCHREQFFARERPAPQICSVCHVKITPRFTERRSFPDLSGRESDFRIDFPHASHIEIVGAAPPEAPPARGGRIVTAAFVRQTPAAAETSDPKSCVVCHQTYLPQGSSDNEYASKPPPGLGDAFWLKRGTFKTTPADHTTCFTCHNEEAGMLPAPSNCNACHKLAPAPDATPVDFDPGLPARMSITDPVMLTHWQRRRSSGTYRHEGGMHPDQACTACHDVAQMNTLDRATLRVPVTACAVCHITATVDDGGILNYEADKRKTDPKFNCTKCHLVRGRDAIPPGHVSAIAAQ